MVSKLMKLLSPKIVQDPQTVLLENTKGSSKIKCGDILCLTDNGNLQHRKESHDKVRYNPEGSFRSNFKRYLLYLSQKATFRGSNCHQLTRIFCKDHNALALDIVNDCQYVDKSNIAPPHSAKSLTNSTVAAEKVEPTTGLIDVDFFPVARDYTSDNDESTLAGKSTDSLITNSGSVATTTSDANGHAYPALTPMSAQEAYALADRIVGGLRNHLARDFRKGFVSGTHSCKVRT